MLQKDSFLKDRISEPHPPELWCTTVWATVQPPLELWGQYETATVFAVRSDVGSWEVAWCAVEGFAAGGAPAMPRHVAKKYNNIHTPLGGLSRWVFQSPYYKPPTGSGQDRSEPRG